MQKKTKVIVFVIAALAFLMLAIGESHSRQTRQAKFLPDVKGYRLGPFEMVPSLLFQNTFDDNALYTNDGHTWDWAFDIEPAVDILAHGSKFDMSVGYKMKVHENVRTNQQRDIGHIFEGDFIATPFGRSISLRIADTLMDTTEPADIEIMERMNMFQNEFVSEMGYTTPGEDLDLRLAYMNLYRTYSEVWDGSSFRGNGIQLSSRLNMNSRYRFLPKTQATFDFTYTRSNQSFNEDVYGGDVISNSYNIMFGVTGAFTRKLSLIAKLGYTRITFNIDQEASSLVAETGVKYNLTRRLSVDLGYSRLVDYSIYSPYSDVNKYSASLGYKLFKKWSLNLDSEFFDIDYSGPVSNGQGELRHDLDIRFKSELSYKIKKWIGITTGYCLERRRSNMIEPVTGLFSSDFLRNSVYISVGINRF